MSHSPSRHTSHTPHPRGRYRAGFSRTQHQWPHLVDSGRGKLPHRPALPPSDLRPAMPACRTCGRARMGIAEAPAHPAVPDSGQPRASWRGKRRFRGHSSLAVDRTKRSGASRGIDLPSRRQFQGNRTARPTVLGRARGNQRRRPRWPAIGGPATCRVSFGLREPRWRSVAIPPAPSTPRCRERRTRYRRPGRPARFSPSG
jgi:hypothetical protein